ncbi:MAG TPA: dihydrolipoyl dehydrogenase [Candidatus Omnitrophota bacterium]|nr:dihydrolipoyl dehydrogenase [Candidatus Omnitrophota bacterium]HRZ15096.1 dihydrolipoyl dehydrogenase [Candidatus Omnitrophota bacterium]
MNYDLIIIGAGWAGFNGFLKARSLGLKTVLIEQSEVGGTCLNRGCIPTKSLIQSAKTLAQCSKAGMFGVELTGETRANFTRMQERKDKLVTQLRQGMDYLLKDAHVIRSNARVLSAHSVSAGGQTLDAGALLICTGSVPAQLTALPFDHDRILSSDDVLTLPALPKSLLIVGGGAIGCEFAGLFAALGVTVTLAEYLPRLLPGVDRAIAVKLESLFRKKGITVLTGTDAGALKTDAYEKILVCTGRRPLTDGLNLEEAGVRLEKQAIEVDENQRTSVHSIYAAGDCTGQVMLAHAAASQSRHAVSVIAGTKPLPWDRRHIPACVFTDPEIAYVGLSEEQAAADGRKAQTVTFDFLGSGMARILEEKDGFVKLVYEPDTRQIIGGSIIGPRAGELIAVVTLAVQHGITVSQLQSTVMAHPSLSESIVEMLQNRP